MMKFIIPLNSNMTAKPNRLVGKSTFSPDNSSLQLILNFRCFASSKSMKFLSSYVLFQCGLKLSLRVKSKLYLYAFHRSKDFHHP